ncbi:MAG: FG-GAP-like repeat-containing protein, partial [candidate division KSB1 bacterium]|nr:FG-GAP-like repeat-containing protein [candidate division KSB1 bacterium]
MSKLQFICCSICLALVPPTLLFAAFSVKSVAPPPQTITAAVAPEIIIEFDAPVDPATVNQNTILIFGRWSGVLPGEFRLQDGNRRARFIPARAFSAGEWITVSISKRVTNQAGEALTNGYAWNFWTKASPGSMNLQLVRQLPVRFEGERPIRVYGVYAGDLNRDGYHDLTVPNEDADDIRVFLNDRQGNFSFSSRHFLPVPARPSTNEGMDFNGDGRIDFAVGNIRGHAVSVLLGDGNGGFLPQTAYPVGREPRGLAVMDLNGDGAMDIVTANRVGNHLSILINNGDGHFQTSQPI